MTDLFLQKVIWKIINKKVIVSFRIVCLGLYSLIESKSICLGICAPYYFKTTGVYIYNTIDYVLSTWMTKRCSVCTEVLTDILAIFATLFEEQIIL